ncbi:MAG: type II secretion system GspH family protein [Elusimicrobiota bacterium]|jgi:prepilin-type N-terminal cleavage/methylation domain-containing protein|nr:type II secretion system GspH family protein [Elusimicrobiota bacterium]
MASLPQVVPHNGKGFSLAELLAVMAIMAILAAVSTFFVRDYMKDAANEKAKVAMQVAAQAYKNFKADYPQALLSGKINGTASIACSRVVRTPGTNNTANTAGVLIGCNYLRGVNFEGQKYNFFVGQSYPPSSQCAGAPASSLACMVGTDQKDDKYGTGKGNSYSAWVTELGQVCEKGKTCP